MSMLLKKKGEKRSSANGRTTDCEILESSVPLLKVAGDSCPDRNAIPTMTEDSSAQPELTPGQEVQSELSKKTDQETEKNDPSADSVGNQTPDETMNNTDIPSDTTMDESLKKAEEYPEHDASNSSRKIDDTIELDSKSSGSNADQGYQDKSADQNSNNAQQNPAEGAHSDSESIYCDCKSVVSLDSMQGTSRTVTANETTVMTSEKTDTIPTDDIGNISKSRKNSSGSSICTYALSTQSTMTDFCRICHCEGDAELGPLIAPCFCRGSLRYVHQACLQQWIKSSDSKHCELCGYHFVMDSKLKPFHKWKKLSMSTTERRKIMCSVMFHIIAITCVIWSLYVLIERTANEIKTGKLEWPFWTKLVVVAIGFTGGLVFMYVQCKVYVQLWRRLKAFNRVIYVKNNLPPTVATLNDDTVNDLQSVASVAENPVSVSSMSEPNQNEEGVVIVQMNCQPN